MYPFANNGEQENNDVFSPCSREMMDDIIALRGQDGEYTYVHVHLYMALYV